MTFNYISLQNRPRQCFYLFCFVTLRVQIVIKPLGLEKESLKFMKCHQHHSHPNENDSKLFKEIIHITMYTIFTFKWQMSQVAVKKKGQLKYFIFVLTHRLKHLDDFMWEVHLSDLWTKCHFSWLEWYFQTFSGLSSFHLCHIFSVLTDVFAMMSAWSKIVVLPLYS